MVAATEQAIQPELRDKVISEFIKVVVEAASL